MQIETKHIKRDSKKKIGKVGDCPVYELSTLGGLSMILLVKNSGPTLLAASPHRAISRFIAKTKEPELVIDELSKSEDLPVAVFKHLIPQYVSLTEQINKKLTE